MKGKLNGSMKNPLILSACALAMLAVTSMPVMAESVELAVKGTIIPAACKPSLTADGIVDYGYITASQLDADKYTLLDPKELTFSIGCEAPVKVAIKAINGQKQSPAGKDGVGINHAAVAPSNVYMGVSRPVVVSMGLDGETSIGGYSVTMKTSGFTASSGASTVSVTPIYKDLASGSDTWVSSNIYNTLYGTGADDLLWSWASVGALPYAFETLTGQLVVQAYINKASELDMSKAIKLNGMTTIELVYL